jgi:hypothetical protein
VIASANPSAARSASEKNGASCQTATAASRRGVSVVFAISPSRHTAQPLIWLVRMWIRWRVFSGIGLAERVLPSVTSGPIASLMIVAGFFIRTCMAGLLRDEPPRFGHIARGSFVIHVTDETQEM